MQRYDGRTDAKDRADHFLLELAASASAFPFLQAMILSFSHVMVSPLRKESEGDARGRQNQWFVGRRGRGISAWWTPG